MEKTMRKLWLIRCECGHSFYVPYENQTWTRKIRTMVLGDRKFPCPVCKGRNARIKRVVTKEVR